MQYGETPLERDSNALVTILATFNSENARGIMHTDEWRSKMAELQQWFDAGRPEPLPRHPLAAPPNYLAAHHNEGEL